LFTITWLTPSKGERFLPAAYTSGIRLFQGVGTLKMALISGKTGREASMARKYIDCREFPSEMNCTVALSADSESELLEAAVQHAVAVHRHQDTPELRAQIKGVIKDGTPPVAAPRAA
jgi:predicted small metal-binding protein